MPAIQVARTDTFEQQRQKINQLGSTLFNITAGGSDLSTGNLKLGDGTRIAPSLAFVSDPGLGIYKPSAKTIGYVSDGRKVANFSPEAFYSFKDLIIQQNILSTGGISILNSGSNYDAGTYSDVTLVGGTGDNATANITVTEFTGIINNDGKNYNEGTYTNIPVTGGSGTGAISSFVVEGIEGDITDAGSGYIPGTYTNISLSSGSGTGAAATVVVTGNTILTGSITTPGSGYTEGSYTFISFVNTPTNTFVLTSIANPGTPPPNNVYQINGVTKDTLTLIRGNTYRFDISNASVATHPLVFRTALDGFLSPQDYVVTQKGVIGTAGAFIDLIIKPTASLGNIKYECSAHTGMGGVITIVSGAQGQYGSFGQATVTVNNSGIVSNFQITSTGSGYKQNDVLRLYSGDVGGTGSGFAYTLGAPTYTGIVSTVTITNNGINYLKDDTLSINSSDIGGQGSNFEFTITSDPGIIKDFEFISKGSTYDVNDLLELPGTITGITTNLKGQVNGVSTTLSNSSPTITVASTVGIIAGMTVSVDFSTSVGQLLQGTTVLSVNGLTGITLSQNPSVSGTAVLNFVSPGSLNQIQLTSVSGILIGSSVSKTAGTGQIANNTTVSSIDSITNIVTLSANPTTAGTATLSFIPPYGTPTEDFEFEILNLGEIENFTITAGGNGYSLNDNLTVSSRDLIQPITYSVTNKNLQTITFLNNISNTVFSVGSNIKLRDGSVNSFTTGTLPTVSPTIVNNISTTLSNSSPIITVSNTTGIVAGMVVSQDLQNDIGRLSAGTTVLSVNGLTQITLSSTPAIAGAATLSFASDKSGTFTSVSSTTSGSGQGATFNVIRNQDGTILSVSINQRGFFYQQNDTITINGGNIGGTTPTHNIVLTVTAVTNSPQSKIYAIKSSGGFIDSMLIDFSGYVDGDIIIKNSSITPTYEIDTASGVQYRYFIDTGSGPELTPNLTFYVGNTYNFNISDSSNSSHIFSLSQFRDGKWTPSLIQGINTTLSTSSAQVTVSSNVGILPGMNVAVTSGTGSLVPGTTVLQVISSNIVVLSDAPLSAGSVTLSFNGVEYTDGVEKSATILSLKVTEDTPNLYYYCAALTNSHANEGGENNEEALITIDPNNPKVFGSNFSVSVAQLNTADVITGNVETGELTAVSFTGDEGTFADAGITGTLTAPIIIGNTISATSISSSTNLGLTATTINATGNFNIGSNIAMVSSTGNITTSGVLKTTDSLNINDRINITNNTISSTAGNNILLSPATGRVAKINTTSAITIPSGTTAQRPAAGIVESGSIRFNTDTGQYEGYSGATTSWSSLGGVRDLDGNTYIAAEASVGANDNTLYFYNDGNNTLKITPTKFIFNVVKTIDSPNPLNPPSTEWAANTPVALNSYVFYGLNLYKVTTGGTTATSGNEPTHTTGTVANGTAQLEWYADYAGDVTFDKVKNVNINTNLVFNDELKLYDNKITTLLSDVVIEPFAGKKVDINTNTSLVLPNGTTGERGIPGQGSVRFNTSLSQFEGYNGVNWTSLGGVRDVDGNTYIIPETAPGSNENILYFYNNGSNTLRLSTTELTFNSIDQIGSTNNNLDLQAQTVTFNSLALTIDNSGTSTKLLSTKTNIDLALSVGLYTNPLIRLNNTGDIYVNKGFGTATDTYIKVLDNELKTFEMDDTIISSSEYILTKGTTNSGASVIFDPTLHSGAKVILIADNATTSHKDMIEFTVIAKGTDIFHTEYGNVVSGTDIIAPVFDFDAGGKVRLNVSLVTGVTTGNVVNVTVVSTIIKK